MDPDPGGPKHTDPTDPDLDSDPDPQHWVFSPLLFWFTNFLRELLLRS